VTLFEDLIGKILYKTKEERMKKTALEIMGDEGNKEKQGSGLGEL